MRDLGMIYAREQAKRPFPPKVNRGWLRCEKCNELLLIVDRYFVCFHGCGRLRSVIERRDARFSWMQRISADDYAHDFPAAVIRVRRIAQEITARRASSAPPATRDSRESGAAGAA